MRPNIIKTLLDCIKPKVLYFSTSSIGAHRPSRPASEETRSAVGDVEHRLGGHIDRLEERNKELEAKLDEAKAEIKWLKAKLKEK
jgi:predicted RNase H-like nuclease (RuvC/YqgF family)